MVAFVGEKLLDVQGAAQVGVIGGQPAKRRRPQLLDLSQFGAVAYQGEQFEIDQCAGGYLAGSSGPGTWRGGGEHAVREVGGAESSYAPPWMLADGRLRHRVTRSGRVKHSGATAVGGHALPRPLPGACPS